MPSTAGTISLVPFTPDHIEDALALSRQAGWPHRVEDWAVVAAVSQGVAALDDERVIGTAFCTPYGSRIAALNMIIVDEAARGRGLGRRLMEAIIGFAGERVMRLVATEKGRRLYEKLDFEAAGRIVQHQGEPGPCSMPGGVDWAGPQDHEALAELDDATFGADRHALYQHILPQAKVALLRQGGGITGFALCRPFGRGRVIGPVVAPDRVAAETLISAQIAAHPGAFLRIDIGEETNLSGWLASCGLSRAGGGILMFRGRPDAARSTSRILALASQAFC